MAQIQLRFVMIFCYICTKSSTRYPGKNDMLLPYTLAWLGYASMYAPEPVTVLSVGPRRPAGLPPDIAHCPVKNGSTHKEALAAAMSYSGASGEDVCALPQLTQPLRSPLLLREAVQACRATGLTVVTANMMQPTGWRALDDAGRWQSHTDEAAQPVIDGRMYAWRGYEGLDDVFDQGTRHAMLIVNEPWGLVDIDRPADVPPGLPAMWAGSLLSHKPSILVTPCS